MDESDDLNLTRRDFLTATGLSMALPAQIAPWLSALAKAPTVTDDQLLAVIHVWREAYGATKGTNFAGKAIELRDAGLQSRQCLTILGQHIGRVQDLLTEGKILPHRDVTSAFGRFINVIAFRGKNRPAHAADGLWDIRKLLLNPADCQRACARHLQMAMQGTFHRKPTDPADAPQPPEKNVQPPSTNEYTDRIRMRQAFSRDDYRKV